MRVARNTGYLKSRQRGARIMVLSGVIGLGSSIGITWFGTTYLIFGYMLLIFGFIFFNAGMQQITMWNRSPRADQMLDQKLRRLNDRYTLIHFPDVPGMRPMHVLVHPSGVLVFTTRIVPGHIRVEENKWRRIGGRLWRIFLFSGPQLGNPTQECHRHQESLRQFIEAQDLPSGDMVDGMIVFLNPRAELEIISSDLTVVKVDDVFKAVRDLGTEALLTAQERDQLVEALSRGDNVEGPISLPAHEQRGKRARAA